MCKDWLPTSRLHQNNETIRFDEECYISFMALVRSPLCTILPSIRIVTLKPSEEDVSSSWIYPALLQLAKLPPTFKLKRVTINLICDLLDPRAKVITKTVVEAFSSMDSITDVRFHNVVFNSFGDLVQVMLSCKRLKYLKLENVNWGKGTSKIPVPPSSLVHFRSLILGLCNCLDICQWLLSLDTMPALEILSLGPQRAASFPALGKVLRALPGLKELYLSLHIWPTERAAGELYKHETVDNINHFYRHLLPHCPACQ